MHSPDDGLELEGLGAQVADEDEVEDGAQEGAHEVGGDARVRVGTRAVGAVEGVGLVLQQQARHTSVHARQQCSSNRAQLYDARMQACAAQMVLCCLLQHHLNTTWRCQSSHGMHVNTALAN